MICINCDPSCPAFSVSITSSQKPDCQSETSQQFDMPQFHSLLDCTCQIGLGSNLTSGVVLNPVFAELFRVGSPTLGESYYSNNPKDAKQLRAI